MTGTGTPPQNGHRPGAEFPMPRIRRTPAPAAASRSKTPDQNLFTKTTRNSPEPFDTPLLTLVIWSPNLGVFAVSAGGVLYAFAAWRTRYLDSVSAGRLTRIPFSLLFLELSGYCLNVVRRHVSAADVLVRCGVDRDDSR